MMKGEVEHYLEKLVGLGKVGRGLMSLGEQTKVPLNTQDILIKILQNLQNFPQSWIASIATIPRLWMRFVEVG